MASKAISFKLRDVVIACSLVAFGTCAMSSALAQRKKTPGANTPTTTPAPEPKSSPASIAKNSAPEEDPNRFELNQKMPNTNNLLPF